MSDLLERESALDGLIERDDLSAMIQKVAEYAPAVADALVILTTISDYVIDERLDEFADQSLDLRRTNMAILVALLHDAFLSLGALLVTIDMAEWIGEDEAIGTARDAVDGLAGALATIAERMHPGDREE